MKIPNMSIGRNAWPLWRRAAIFFAAAGIAGSLSLLLPGVRDFFILVGETWIARKPLIHADWHEELWKTGVSALIPLVCMLTLAVFYRPEPKLLGGGGGAPPPPPPPPPRPRARPP
ncbi:MAG: hypothetical protein LBR23_00970, partial [Spirochaetaceae bacterium]|nr:hypothetical protein [Spirochaetaceae bacterium]